MIPLEYKVGDTLTDGFRVFVLGIDKKFHQLATRGIHASYRLEEKELDEKLKAN